jgi:Cu/Ag efflux pump CusA
MTRAVVGWSLRFRVLVVGLAAGLMLFGTLELQKAPIDVVPDFGPTYVEVQTEALGLSASEVEQLITVPLEADLLQGVAFLDSIESESVEGLSSIVMTFEPGTDLFQARQVVAERLTQAHALPNVSKPPLMLQPLASTNRVLMVSMVSTDSSLIDMSILARWTIRPRLLGVPGVANVAIWGLRERQLQVLIDPTQLRNQRVSIQHVLETAGNAMWVSPLTFLDASTPGTGGFIDTPNQRLGVQHVFPIRSAADLAEVPIAPEDTGGRIVRLGDVSTIVEDHQPLIGDAIVGGAGDGLLLVVEKFPGADTRTVTAGVEAALAALQPGLTGIQLDTNVFRPATYIDSAVGNVSFAALAGLLLAMVALMLVFRNWRSVLIALLTIPLALAAAASVLYLLGATISAVTVAGIVLAVGMVVDEIVVGVDAVARRLRPGLRHRLPACHRRRNHRGADGCAGPRLAPVGHG